MTPPPGVKEVSAGYGELALVESGAHQGQMLNKLTEH